MFIYLYMVPYCKMDSKCGNITGGRMRVAYLDMKSSKHQCPSELELLSRNPIPTRLCDINRTGRASTFYTVHSKQYYNRVYV